MKTWAFALALAVCAGCREEQPAAKPVADTTPQGPLENTDPTPVAAPEQSRIGQMPLLRGAPADARCSTSGVAAPRLVMEGDVPLRRITVGVGDTTRAFRPTYIEVASHQAGADGREENETIYLGFDANGGVESGRRQYFITGNAPMPGPLLPEDADAAKQLALQVLERCKK
ncbi:MAG TPA: hypothetical protein VFT29_01520 [Gemmatimonadaceae bacterium]|nr:hypothetical protein [Gemmatimonadaceae bacterium]